MRAPRPEPRARGNRPVTPFEPGYPRPDGDDLEDALVAGDEGRARGAEEGGEGRERAVGALDGVDVGGVDGGGEGAEEEGGRGQGRRDGVRVQVQGGGGFAEFGADEGAGLGVAVGAGEVVDGWRG
ncbi:hypothetical protein QBC39DRAFT_429464 [Podospora conica]|nr:hypothetical protein QBC39DRAFT_429464 [Schizothecium conicum]